MASVSLKLHDTTNTTPCEKHDNFDHDYGETNVDIRRYDEIREKAIKMINHSDTEVFIMQCLFFHLSLQ